MTSTPRVQKARAEALKKGLKRREYSLTDDEHAKLKALLKELRGA